MSFEIVGNAHTKWSGTRDEEGHREYVITHRIRGNSTDGPAAALETPGLPLPGSSWSVDDDQDQYAYCTWKSKQTPVYADEPCLYFDVEQIFTTKPPSRDTQRCQDVKIEDPILEPAKISGSFVNYNEEATHDRFGVAIVNSAHEQMRGPQVEFSKNRPRITIEQNVATSNLAYIIPAKMQNTVNMYAIWGLPPRTVLLAEAAWERKFYGQCYVYYTRKLTFDVDYQTFDRDLLDEGSKCLRGEWNNTTGHWVLTPIGGLAPDPFNPSHFTRFKDRNGENCRVILNGLGLPSGVCVDAVVNNVADENWWGEFDVDVTPGMYLSLEGANLGHSLGNNDRWVLIRYAAPILSWDNLVRYRRGSLASVGADNYVCLASNVGDTPPSTNWRILPGAGLTDRGTYSASVTYASGDYVTQSATTTSTGSGTGTGTVDCEETLEGHIPVQYYEESNFLLLGIPLDF